MAFNCETEEATHGAAAPPRVKLVQLRRIFVNIQHHQHHMAYVHQICLLQQSNGPLYFRRKGPMGIAVHLKIQCTSAPLALGDDLSTIVLAL